MIDLYEQLLGGNLCSTGNLLYSVIIFKKIKEYNIKIEATRWANSHSCSHHSDRLQSGILNDVIIL